MVAVTTMDTLRRGWLSPTIQYLLGSIEETTFRLLWERLLLGYQALEPGTANFMGIPQEHQSGCKWLMAVTAALLMGLAAPKF